MASNKLPDELKPCQLYANLFSFNDYVYRLLGSDVHEYRKQQFRREHEASV